MGVLFELKDSLSIDKYNPWTRSKEYKIRKMLSLSKKHDLFIFKEAGSIFDVEIIRLICNKKKN